MLGSLNPCPFRVGGGPTPSSKAYATLRQAVGKGGSAENDRGIDGLWRRSRAKGAAAGSSSVRRALLQAFPQLATDLLPYYERRLGLAAAPDATEDERRQAVLERWTEQAIRNSSDLAAALADIDSRFSVTTPADVTEVVGVPGRAFDSYDPSVDGPPFLIPGGCTEWPMFSTRQVLRVVFALGYAGVMTPADLVLYTRAQALLRRVLPSDVDFTISTGAWVLGTTPIGFGALG